MGRGTIPQSRILRLKLNTDFLSCVCHIMWSWSAMLALNLCDSDLAASVEESCGGSPFVRKMLLSFGHNKPTLRTLSKSDLVT